MDDKRVWKIESPADAIVDEYFALQRKGRRRLRWFIRKYFGVTAPQVRRDNWGYWGSDGKVTDLIFPHRHPVMPQRKGDPNWVDCRDARNPDMFRLRAKPKAPKIKEDLASILIPDGDWLTKKLLGSQRLLVGSTLHTPGYNRIGDTWYIVAVDDGKSDEKWQPSDGLVEVKLSDYYKLVEQEQRNG